MSESLKTSSADRLAAARSASLSGDLERAEALWRELLADRHLATPDRARAHSGLGFVLTRRGDPEAAIAQHAAAAALLPGEVACHANLGSALLACGRAAEAEASFRAAARLLPGDAGILRKLGEALDRIAAQAGDVEAARRAVASYAEAVRLAPDRDDLREAHAAACYRAGDRVAAAASLAALATRRSDDPRLQAQLGHLYTELQEHDAAIRHWRAALALQPDAPDHLRGLGIALFRAGRHGDAEARFEQALARAPDDPAIRLSLAGARLARGDFAGGLPLFEARFDPALPAPAVLPWTDRVPPWRGEPIAGRHVLLQAEQGFGDSMQCVRYLPRVAAEAAAVTLQVPAALVRLLAAQSGGWSVVPQDQPPPAADLQLPLMSLPLAFATTLETIPAAVPYLAPDPAIAARWAAMLPRGRRIGVAWASDLRKPEKSIPLALLAGALAASGAALISLQVGVSAGEAVAVAGLSDLSPALVDFAETAGVIAGLDLVISVDTAVAHLAGALGKPVWLLERFVGDWRWLHGRADSPWYPTMRIYRQAAAGDWASVAARLDADLAAWRSGRAPP